MEKNNSKIGWIAIVLAVIILGVVLYLDVTPQLAPAPSGSYQHDTKFCVGKAGTSIPYRCDDTSCWKYAPFECPEGYETVWAAAVLDQETPQIICKAKGGGDGWLCHCTYSCIRIPR